MANTLHWRWSWRYLWPMPDTNCKHSVRKCLYISVWYNYSFVYIKCDKCCVSGWKNQCVARMAKHISIIARWFVLEKVSSAKEIEPQTKVRKDFTHRFRKSQFSTMLSSTPTKIRTAHAHRRFRGIECRVQKICDSKKVILSLFFKHNIAGLGVLIPKRYHMLG